MRAVSQLGAPTDGRPANDRSRPPGTQRMRAGALDHAAPVHGRPTECGRQLSVRHLRLYRQASRQPPATRHRRAPPPSRSHHYQLLQLLLLMLQQLVAAAADTDSSSLRSTEQRSPRFAVRTTDSLRHFTVAYTL